MPRGNPKNLIPNSERTPEQLREQTRKGGIRSGEAKREKKLLSQIYAEMLMDEYEVTVKGETKKVTGSKLVKTVARDVLMRRDSASVSMMKEIREATEGQNVNLSGMVETASLTPDERKARIAELEAKRHA
jgi:hypothetical protein